MNKRSPYFLYAHKLSLFGQKIICRGGSSELLRISALVRETQREGFTICQKNWTDIVRRNRYPVHRPISHMFRTNRCNRRPSRSPRKPSKGLRGGRITPACLSQCCAFSLSSQRRTLACFSSSCRSWLWSSCQPGFCSVASSASPLKEGRAYGKKPGNHHQ